MPPRVKFTFFHILDVQTVVRYYNAETQSTPLRELSTDVNTLL